MGKVYEKRCKERRRPAFLEGMALFYFEYDRSERFAMRAVKSCFATKKWSKAYAALFLLVIVGCGGMNSNRVLMSMTLSPASADAQNSTNGQVKFTATGNFSQPPSPALVTFTEPYTGTWSSSNFQIATIDQTGVAQCVQGATGMVTISAIVSSNSAKAPAMSTAVSAEATLKCP